ncbi:MAG: acyltransferase family protein [Marinibacterium sp.]
MSQRNLSLDILKLGMAALVVIVHVNALTDISVRVSYLLNHGVFRVVVPIFLIISGYYFAASGRNGIWSWTGRLLFLYLLWTAIYIPFWIPSINGDPERFLKTLLFGYWHLWYLVAACIAGVMLHFAAGLRDRTLLILSALLFAAGTVLQYAGDLEIFDHLRHASRLNSTYASQNFLFFGFPFVTMGFVIRRSGIVQRLPRRNTVILMLAGLGLVAVESAITLHIFNNLKGYNLLLAVWIAAPLIFIATLQFPIYGNNRTLGDLAVGIYFVHILVYLLIKEWIDVSPSVMAVIVLTLSAMLAWGLVRLKPRLALT